MSLTQPPEQASRQELIGSELHAPRAGATWLAGALLGALLVIVPETARSADTQGNFALRGAGSVPCAQVVQRVGARAPDLPQFVAWADGALSQANRIERETFDLLPFERPAGLLTMLALNICRANPQVTFGAAVFQAIEAVKPLRVRQAAQPVTITVGEASVALRPETIRLVQTRLRELNLLTAQPDGRWGPASRAAIKRFQESRNLRPTEIPDTDTVVQLILRR
ncbi:MAG: hypothetical protein GC150_17370 [Rhizobiales bacterium]|nr:hypothetical protein [Hyphomicrobiales bacterium]